MTADKRVDMRLKAKAKLADVLAPLYRGDVDAEVIVRDADRNDGYPQSDDKFRLWRLSPWFKAELVKPWGDGISVLAENLTREYCQGYLDRSGPRPGQP